MNKNLTCNLCYSKHWKMTSVESLYNSSKIVNDAKTSSYVERFTKDLLDATKRGVYHVNLWFDDEDTDYMSDKPRPYVYKSIDIIKEKYRGITEELQFECGYVVGFIVSWKSSDTLSNLSKITNTTMTATYVEIFTKGIIDATKKGRYSTELRIPDYEFNYDISDDPCPYVFAAIHAIKDIYKGIQVYECKKDGYLKHFLVNWDESTISKYQKITNNAKINEYVRHFTLVIEESDKNHLCFAKLYASIGYDYESGARQGHPMPFVYAAVENIRKQYVDRKIVVEEREIGYTGNFYFHVAW